MRFLTLLITITVTLHAAGAKTINVADYGIVPGKDVTYEVNRLIESMQDNSRNSYMSKLPDTNKGTKDKEITLFFPKGQYDFHPENALETYRAVANHDNGLKRMAFPLFDCENLTIDGNGSLFMMHGRIIPFTLERCRNVTLKNLTIDWIRSFHAEMKVLERDMKTKSALFEVDEQRYPHRIRNGQLFFERFGREDPIGFNIVFDPKTCAPIYETKKYVLKSGEQIKVSKPGKNRIRIISGFKKEPPPVGSVLVAYGVHPTSRLCHAIQITNSEDIRIENLTIHDAGGMGLIVERTENVTLNGMKVTSNKERLVSTRADATHFIGCKGTITLKNCLFEHMLDDGINVHGAYVQVVRYLGNKTFLCSISHFQQWGLTFGEPGDRIALLSRETVLPFYETTIKKIKVLNEQRFVMTVENLPDKLPDIPMSVENLTWHPDLIMRNNIIRKNRARSVLVTTKGKVLIENNRFSSQMHGILIEGDNNKWYESGAVRDVTIRNNVFNNIGFAVNKCYPLFASPKLNNKQHFGKSRYHRNITFTDNIIRSFNGHLVLARSVDGLKISGNRVDFSTDYPEAREGPAIDLEYCNHIMISNNTYTSFSEAPVIRLSADNENISIDHRQGFKIEKR